MSNESARSTAPLTYEESVEVGVPPDEVYAVVSDVTRTGEWSPICTSCWWEVGDVPAGEVGSWFGGRNETPTRTWETRSQVVVADGREFAFVVGGSYVRWGYAVTPVDGGTRLTESWAFLPEGLAMFSEKYGEDAGTQVRERTAAARSGIPASLAALKQLLEHGGAGSHDRSGS